MPDDAKFCMDCGYSMVNENKKGSNIFSNGTIFIVLIVAILVIGGIFILTSGFGGNNQSKDVVDETHDVDLTITGVGGWHSDGDEDKSYSLYTEAIFNNVPNDLKGYNIKTSYYDSNDTLIGHETETLSNVYYESDYALSFGFYTTYKMPNPDHVTVEVIKGGKVIDSYTEQID